jgi:hypothetical protein
MKNISKTLEDIAQHRQKAKKGGDPAGKQYLVWLAWKAWYSCRPLLCKPFRVLCGFAMGDGIYGFATTAMTARSGKY